MTLTGCATRARELTELVERLDDEISTENQRAFLHEARQLAPDVAGIILWEPDDLEGALQSIDPDSRNGAKISWQLGQQQLVPTDRILKRDGTVGTDTQRVAEVLELLQDPDDFPIARVGDILPELTLEQTLDRIGWRPWATLTEDEIAHDQDAMDDERSGQRIGPIRDYVICELPAILSLMESDTSEPQSASLEDLLEKRAALAHELKVESDFGFVLKVLERFPAAESFVAGVALGEEAVTSVLDAHGGTLYSIADDEGHDPSWSYLADGSRPSGEPVALDPELLHPWTGVFITDGIRVSVSQTLSRRRRQIVDEFVDRGLFSSSWIIGESGWQDRAEHHLSGGPGAWAETDASNFMRFADGALEQALLKVLCRAAAVELQPTFRLMSGKDFRDRVRPQRSDGRLIDLVIADTQDDQETWEPVAAIEIKFEAKVHGRPGYCTNPEHDSVYSNQIICYPRGCTHHALRGDKIQFLWIGPGNYRSVADANFAITESDVAYNRPRFEAAFQEQEEASKQWRVTSWSQVIESLKNDLAPYGPRIVAAVERAFATESAPRGEGD